MKKTGLLFSSILMLQILFAQNSPVAYNDTFSINKNITTAFYVIANDYDLDGDPLTITILVSSQHGTATISGNNIVYTPSLNYTGNDSITYIICDTTNRCDTATVFITVIANNNPPVANDDNYVVQQNINTILAVSSNDYDPDGDALTLTIITPPQHGMATVINTTQIFYSPNSFYYGADTIVYVLCDNNNLCDTAVVYIVVNGSNNPPIAADDSYSFTDSFSSNVLSVLSNDSDPENDTVYVTQVFDNDTLNNLGTISLESGNVMFARSVLGCGTETFQYLVCDYQLCDTGNITITITCPDNIFLPQGFSPDGDGKNDKLVFTGLEYFAPATLKIFNRYGSIVYENTDYKNDWNGTYIENDKPLPDGTYFYTLQLNDKRRYNNYLIINR